MRKIKRMAVFLLAVCLMGCSGCGLRNLDDLYALPTPSVKHQDLQQTLEEILSQGMEYAAPLTGENTQSVQMHDLDGDNVDEVVAFFRDLDGENKPLKIYILKQTPQDTYDVAAIISGDGLAVNSIVFCQMNDTPEQEVVISWQMSRKVYALSAYSLSNYTVKEELSISSYSRYCVEDMDRDNRRELTVFQLGATDETGNRADYFDWNADGLAHVNTVPVSSGLMILDEINYHYLMDSDPALYISGQDTESAANRRLTDVLAVRDGKLENISLNVETRNSQLSALPLVDNQDVNQDNIMEIALPVAMAGLKDSGETGNDYLLAWVQYQLDGGSVVAGYTYHNTADGWYLWVPESWVGTVAATREDINEGSTVERAVHFSYWVTGQEEAERFLSIYVNTGANRTSRSASGNRILLATRSDAVYSAEFYESDWRCGINGLSISEVFNTIETTWS